MKNKFLLFICILLVTIFSSCSSDDNNIEKRTHQKLENTNWIQDGYYIIYDTNNKEIDTPYLKNNCKSAFSFNENSGNMTSVYFKDEKREECFTSNSHIIYSVQKQHLVIEHNSSTIAYEIKKLTNTRLELIKYINEQGDYIQMNYNKK